MFPAPTVALVPHRITRITTGESNPAIPPCTSSSPLHKLLLTNKAVGVHHSLEKSQQQEKLSTLAPAFGFLAAPRVNRAAQICQERSRSAAP